MTMQIRTTITTAILMAVLAVPALAVAEESAPGSTSAQKAPAGGSSGLPSWVPPSRGSTQAARLGGATRSAGNDALPRIEALVPQEAGWTLEQQPVLYWYLSKPTDVPIELVVVRVEPLEQILKVTLPSPDKAGVQRIRLADHGVKIEPGSTYQWLVKLVPNPDDRSYDRIVGGGIERVKPSESLSEALASAGPDQRAYVLAGNGIWYDAIDDLSVRIDAAPGDRQLWNQRAHLFQQVGLPEVDLESDAADGFQPR
jgi:hypothetical protein